MHTASPSAAKARRPMSTARLSHHRTAGRNTRRARSTSTKPCIWYDSPMALTSRNAAGCAAANCRLAAQMCVHHTSGSCSAQPTRGAWMGSSSAGETAEPSTAPLPASTNAALTAELPIS